MFLISAKKDGEEITGNVRDICLWRSLKWQLFLRKFAGA